MLSKLSTVPQKPGIYLFKDAKKKILYVGKAKNLRNRLKNYFQKSTVLDHRKSAMIKLVNDFSFIVTANELEALVLEGNLIKQYKPRFNIILRDDKNYPYIKLTIHDDWPFLEVVRKIEKDGSLYFGPYVPAGIMWELLAFIRRNFQIRDCRFSLDKKIRPCIQHQMGKCLAPCAGNISKREYRNLIHEVELFLKGKRLNLITMLEEKMSRLSEETRYEEAAEIRDRIKALRKAWEIQRVVSPKLGATDIIGFYRKDATVVFTVFFVRNGMLIGTKNFFVRENISVPDHELFHAFFIQFYSGEVIPPSEILLPVLPADYGSVEMFLKELRQDASRIRSPKSGKKKELIDMAMENAKLTYESSKEHSLETMLRELQERLKLRKRPNDIGAVDASTLSGKEAVGSFVYWSRGAFSKDFYRRLRIKTVTGINDYSMMEEIISRIMTDLGEKLPDLMIIDGGKGHLEAVRTLIHKKRAMLKKIPFLVAIAKKPDRAFISSSSDAINLNDKKQSSLLLKSVRDEAHRFAVGYHRKLREKELFMSPLEQIKGIGKKRRLALLRVFGSIEGVKNSTVEEIAKLKSFNRALAERLLRELGRHK